MDEKVAPSWGQRGYVLVGKKQWGFCQLPVQPILEEKSLKERTSEYELFARTSYKIGTLLER
jgi:hypothetical protein